MRILIYGAGMIGSLYAALFAEAGYDTSVYARGKRLEFLKKNGLLYKKKQNIKRAETTILEGIWVAGRRLNGDEAAAITFEEYRLVKIKLFLYGNE